MNLGLWDLVGQDYFLAGNGGDGDEAQPSFDIDRYVDRFLEDQEDAFPLVADIVVELVQVVILIFRDGQEVDAQVSVPFAPVHFELLVIIIDRPVEDLDLHVCAAIGKRLVPEGAVDVLAEEVREYAGQGEIVLLQRGIAVAEDGVPGKFETDIPDVPCPGGVAEGFPVVGGEEAVPVVLARLVLDVQVRRRSWPSAPCRRFRWSRLRYWPSRTCHRRW